MPPWPSDLYDVQTGATAPQLARWLSRQRQRRRLTTLVVTTTGPCAMWEATRSTIPLARAVAARKPQAVQ
jgi:hypothetical protein